jgi:sulfide:quinone oxidoreductase
MTQAAPEKSPGTSTPTEKKWDVLVIGAGTGGMTVAAMLRRLSPSISVGILDPATIHYYQPLWTLVGGGIVPKEKSGKPLCQMIPGGADWIQDAVSEIHPEENHVITKSGKRYDYGYLVMAPGLTCNWDEIPGLAENVGANGVCSNYSYDTVDSTWANIKAFEGGNAIFTHPNTPIKCGGAPQKIMYLAADYWRKHPPKNPYKVIFCIATPTIFGVPAYADALLGAVKRYGIEVRFENNLTSIDAKNQTADFEHLGDGAGCTLDYSMLHVTPPMGAPEFLKQSPLAGAGGWCDVDKHTLLHVKFDNVFALGDASNLPTSKTGAAIRQQAPTLYKNLLASMEGKTLSAKYTGYTSCPLVTGYNKLVLAEFDYDKNLRETFPFDQTKERWSMFFLKKNLLPKFYWSMMMKGRP